MTKTKFQQKCFELFNTPELIASQLEELEKFHEEEIKRGKEEVLEEIEKTMRENYYEHNEWVIDKTDWSDIKQSLSTEGKEE